LHSLLTPSLIIKNFIVFKMSREFESSIVPLVPYRVNERVMYTKGGFSTDVTVIAVDLSDGEAFYTILGMFGEDKRLVEKQTVSQYLLPIDKPCNDENIIEEQPSALTSGNNDDAPISDWKANAVLVRSRQLACY
jgi:hypothetical protein